MHGCFAKENLFGHSLFSLPFSRFFPRVNFVFFGNRLTIVLKVLPWEFIKELESIIPDCELYCKHGCHAGRACNMPRMPARPLHPALATGRRRGRHWLQKYRHRCPRFFLTWKGRDVYWEACTSMEASRSCSLSRNRLVNGILCFLWRQIFNKSTWKSIVV